MGKINTLKKLLNGDKRQIIISCYNNIVHTGFTNLLSDKLYLKLTYRIRFGEKLDLKNPVTYNQKLQWLKLNDRNPDYIKMVDKIEAKEYVKNIIGGEYIIPTIGTWNDINEIDFDSLPNQFVLKCSHDSGSIIVCKDKKSFDIKKAKKRLSKGLKTEAFYWGREWPYKGVKPRIIAEKYMEDIKAGELQDYKFFCFDGKVKMMFIATGRQKKDAPTCFDFFDREFNHLDMISIDHPNSSKIPEKPQKYAEMIELAEKLAKNIPHVRVDFYEVENIIYFGELTFFQNSGFVPLEPKEWDYKMGEWIKLPKEI